MYRDAEKKLRAHGVRPTRVRRELIRLLQSADFALSHADIERYIGADYDRVTIYRTLSTFDEFGLIHKIMDENGFAKYAMCSHDECQPGFHKDDHLHFTCTECEQTYCLPHTRISNLDVPDGFEIQNFILKAEGKCKTCTEFHQINTA